MADAVAITLALGGTHWGINRTGTILLDWPYFPVPYSVILPVLGTLWLLALVLVRRNGRWLSAGATEFHHVVTTTFAVFGAVAIVSYLSQAHLSRLLFALALPVSLVLLLAGRAICRKVLNGRRRRNLDMDNVLLVATTATAATVLADVRERPMAGLKVTHVAMIDEPSNAPPADLEGARPVPSSRIIEYAGRADIQAVIAGPGIEPQHVRELAWALEETDVNFLVAASTLDVNSARIHATPTAGLNLVVVDLPRFTASQRIAKRILDVIFSISVMLLLSPVFFVIAVAIRLDSPGPAVFRQRRIGLNGKPFTIHKFRTMVNDAESRAAALIAESGGPALRFKLRDDPRVTRVGAWLRQSSLDELPQFWDVLRGPMSVVGPRPQVDREVAEYDDTMRRRLRVKPGITGLWQINGRSDLPPAQATRWDLYYVDNWSLEEDLVIILKTVGVVLGRSGAY